MVLERWNSARLTAERMMNTSVGLVEISEILAMEDDLFYGMAKFDRI